MPNGMPRSLRVEACENPDWSRPWPGIKSTQATDRYRTDSMNRECTTRQRAQAGSADIAQMQAGGGIGIWSIPMIRTDTAHASAATTVAVIKLSTAYQPKVGSLGTAPWLAMEASAKNIGSKPPSHSRNASGIAAADAATPAPTEPNWIANATRITARVLQGSDRAPASGWFPARVVRDGVAGWGICWEKYRPKTSPEQGQPAHEVRSRSPLPQMVSVFDLPVPTVRYP